MHVRTAQPNLRPIIVAAALLGLALTFGSWPAAAQEWTPRQRAACEPDAIRLCQQYISDIGRVRSCPITVATLAPPAVPCSTAVRRRRRRDALGERRIDIVIAGDASPSMMQERERSRAKDSTISGKR